MNDPLLPPEFAELEFYAATWCLATEPERWAQRLLQLLHSLLMVSYAVEVWRQREVIHCGSAGIDRVLEPRP